MSLPPSVGGPGVGDPDAPVGIFDSGVGGLTVARAVIDQLPDEQILYVGDTARGPYGPRPIAEVRAFAGAGSRPDESPASTTTARERARLITG